ncbi:MAG: RidA family protein [Actinobacteria bacterium]|nr:RidA family protein [Actinomycetota bacterium]
MAATGSSGVIERLSGLGLMLPEPIPAIGKYRPVVVHGDVAHTSGLMAVTGPPLQIAYPGRVGDDLTIDDGKQSARGALLSTLAQLQVELGDLGRIERFLHVRGYVCATADFDKVHHVVGAANALVVELFGDDAIAGRTAVGVATLPERASVILECTVAVRA